MTTYYRLQEVEKRLSVSRSQLKRLIYDRKLRAIKLGDGPTTPWRVSEEEIQRYLAEREGKST